MGQFVCTDIKNLCGFPDIKAIMEKFASVLRELEGTHFMSQVPYEVSSCITGRYF